MNSPTPKLLMGFCLLCTLGGCQHLANTADSRSDQANSETPDQAVILKDAPIIHDTKFRVVKVNTTIESFEAAGFQLGDSVDAMFNTGYALNDIPYYNGFYVEQGVAMIVGYPGRTYLYLGYNDADDVWDLGKLDEQSTVTLSLHQKAKYKSVQEAFQLVYSDNRDDFDTDTTFANYRAMTGGHIQPNIFFRSASPCDNQHQRAPYVDALMQKDNIQYVINMSDNGNNINKYLADKSYTKPYFEKLYADNRVSLLDLSSNYRLPEFKKGVADSLIKMIDHNGPYLVHCVEGKDRTGFFAILMEGLCGASYAEMNDDYMITYDMYYGVTKQNRPQSYQAISSLLFDAMVAYLANTKDLNVLQSMNYAEAVSNYLKEGGMTQDQISVLKSRICMPK